MSFLRLPLLIFAFIFATGFGVKELKEEVEVIGTQKAVPIDESAAAERKRIEEQVRRNWRKYQKMSLSELMKLPREIRRHPKVKKLISEKKQEKLKERREKAKAAAKSNNTSKEAEENQEESNNNDSTGNVDTGQSGSQNKGKSPPNQSRQAVQSIVNKIQNCLNSEKGKAGKINQFCEAVNVANENINNGSKAIKGESLKASASVAMNIIKEAKELIADKKDQNLQFTNSIKSAGNLPSPSQAFKVQAVNFYVSLQSCINLMTGPFRDDNKEECCQILAEAYEEGVMNDAQQMALKIEGLVEEALYYVSKGANRVKQYKQKLASTNFSVQHGRNQVINNFERLAGLGKIVSEVKTKSEFSKFKAIIISKWRANEIKSFYSKRTNSIFKNLEDAKKTLDKHDTPSLSVSGFATGKAIGLNSAVVEILSDPSLRNICAY